jgi:hypothetical protein
LALVTNRRNAASYARGFLVGGAESWDTFRRDTFINIYASEADVSDRSGIPNGYNTGAILLPLKDGGMSIYEPEILNLVKLNADAKMGRNAEVSASLSITVTNAQADQIVSLEGSGALAITVSNAGLSAGVQASASGNLIITGNFSLGGIIPVEASSALSITPNTTMTALANMIATAGGPPPLSPEGLAVAVWSENLSGYNTTSTAGKVLKDAGGAGNPWSADLASNNNPGTFGNLVQRLLTVAKFLGLK